MPVKWEEIEKDVRVQRTGLLMNTVEGYSYTFYVGNTPTTIERASKEAMCSAVPCALARNVLKTLDEEGRWEVGEPVYGIFTMSPISQGFNDTKTGELWVVKTWPCFYKTSLESPIPFSRGDEDLFIHYLLEWNQLRLEKEEREKCRKEMDRLLKLYE